MGGPNKSTAIIFALWTNLAALAYTMRGINDRLKPVRIPLSTVKWFEMGMMRFNQSLHAWYYVRQGCQIISKCKQNSCTFVCFYSRIVILISNRFQRDVSNERKQICNQICKFIIFSRVFTLRVMILTLYIVINRFAWPGMNLIHFIYHNISHNKTYVHTLKYNKYTHRQKSQIYCIAFPLKHLIK